ncbi:ABC transporter permease [Pelagibius sp.]|uniref:ABC transporter permease n=1 Tax=Pelagibius sp. TaxID=1931238 RepID=UPI003BAFF500
MNDMLQHRVIRVSVLVLVSGYLILPTLIVVWLSFGQDDFLRFPPNLFSWQWYTEFLTDEHWNEATLRTAIVGAMATGLTTIVGSAAAFAVARTRLPGKQFVEALAIAPLVVPPIVLAAGGYSLYLDLGLIGSSFGLAVMHAVLGVPYVFLIVSAALTRTDPNVELAALSLGADRWRTMWDVTIPTNMPSILTGALFAFLVSFDEVVVTVFLAGTLGPTLPVRVFASLSFAVSPVVAAVSALQILVALVLLAQLGLLKRWQVKRTQAVPAVG